MNITLEEALTKVPTRDEMWQVVQEVRDYLYEYLNIPESRVIPGVGEVVFDAGEWGKRMMGPTPGCYVCLAGIWYLRKLGVLLDEVLPRFIPPIANRLDDMRLPYYRSEQHIADMLGIDALPILKDWDSSNPHHILRYLDWLLEQQHGTPTTNTP